MKHPIMAQWLTNLTRNMRFRVPSLALLGSGVAMSCGVGRRCGSDPVLLWLWCRLVTIAPIRLLAWEPPYAAGAAPEKIKRPKKKKKRKKEKEMKHPRLYDHILFFKFIYSSIYRTLPMGKVLCQLVGKNSRH